MGKSTTEIIELFECIQKVPYDFYWKATKQLIRKIHTEQINNTTDLIGIKDNNITIQKALDCGSHREIYAKLDYSAPLCPHCRGIMIKYDFQKTSKIPIPDTAFMPTILLLKKRHFQCKACKRGSETPLVKKIIKSLSPFGKKLPSPIPKVWPILLSLI